MKWSEAKNQALDTWESVRSSIGTVPVNKLLEDLNAMSELCDKAAEESHGKSRCEYCLAFQQSGGCSELTARMSHHADNKEWEKVRDLAGTFMERIKAIDTGKDD
jgi:hypothetical protein